VWWFAWVRRAESLRGCCAGSTEQRRPRTLGMIFVRPTWVAVAVLAAGVGVGHWRISVGGVGLEDSGVMFGELIEPADGELD
jgi:hypothetical protein